MKLKFELINGYGVLVDEEVEIKEGDWYFDAVIGLHQKLSDLVQTTVKLDRWKIIFAEPELNLEGVPVFEWRDFEVEKLAKESLPDDTDWQKRFVFVQGYKSNPAKYTESDLEDLLIAYNKARDNDEHFFIDEYIQSLQKYTKYVVMESEIISLLPTGNHTIKKEDVSKTFKTDFKLFTNSEGKQQGTVKELIWT
jgi:hypothetical protein